MKFDVSRTLPVSYSSFIETIFLIERSSKLFLVKGLENRRKSFLAALSVILLVIPTLSTAVSPVAAEEPKALSDVRWGQRGNWIWINSSLVTLIFPADGSKPMFLWWYTEDPSKVYVVKFKGLIEYLTFDRPYYTRKHAAEGLTIHNRIKEKFVEPKMGYLHGELRRKVMKRMEFIKAFIGMLFDLHPPYLPFSGCRWELEGPSWVKKDDISYLSFNFTLRNSPMPFFEFAEDNIEIRCRFYNTSVTEVVDEEHSYTVDAGQLKMDFVVKNWSWNIDRIQSFLDELREEYGITVPPHRSGLALWVNLASINVTRIQVAESEIVTRSDNMVEENSQANVAYIGSELYSLSENETAGDEDERPLQIRHRIGEQLRIRFGKIKEEETVAGFFEFVPWARLINATGETVGFLNVTGSYIAAGGHLRLFVCYPYFGNLTLEHDPSIGLAFPSIPPPAPTLLTPELVGALLIAAAAIAAVILAARWRRGFVNIVKPH